MKTIHTYVADGNSYEPFIEPLTIVCDEVTSDAGDAEAYRAFYQGAACRLLDALQETVPGGLMDALLAELCHRKAVLLRVPMES